MVQWNYRGIRFHGAIFVPLESSIEPSSWNRGPPAGRVNGWSEKKGRKRGKRIEGCQSLQAESLGEEFDIMKESKKNERRKNILWTWNTKEQSQFHWLYRNIMDFSHFSWNMLRWHSTLSQSCHGSNSALRASPANIMSALIAPKHLGTSNA